MFASEVSLKSDLRGKEGHSLLPPKSASSVIPILTEYCGPQTASSVFLIFTTQLYS